MKKIITIFFMPLLLSGCGLFAGKNDYTTPAPKLPPPATAEQDMDRAYTRFQGAMLGAEGKTQAELEEIFGIKMRDLGTHEGKPVRGWRQYGGVAVGDRAGRVNTSSVLIGSTVYTTGTVAPGAPGWAKSFDCRAMFLFDENGVCRLAESDGDCFDVTHLSRTGLSVEIE